MVVDRDENALARRPWAGYGMSLHMGEQLIVDALGGLAQRKLSERRQVAGVK